MQCHGTPCLSFAATMGRVSNITFRQLGQAELACVDILHGRLELETCVVSSQTADGIWIHDGADPRIRYSNFHSDNKKAGIVSFSDGLGTIEENTLFHNGGPGIEVTTGSSPTVRNNIIRDNRGPRHPNSQSRIRNSRRQRRLWQRSRDRGADKQRRYYPKKQDSRQFGTGRPDRRPS